MWSLPIITCMGWSMPPLNIGFSMPGHMAWGMPMLGGNIPWSDGGAAPIPAGGGGGRMGERCRCLKWTVYLHPLRSNVQYSGLNSRNVPCSCQSDWDTGLRSGARVTHALRIAW